MANPLSPYALLKRSKPKPPASYTTPYDDFSAAQQAAHSAPEAPAQDIPTILSSSPAPIASPPLQRTHYISSITKKHDHAARRTTMNAVFSQNSVPF